MATGKALGVNLSRAWREGLRILGEVAPADPLASFVSRKNEDAPEHQSTGTKVAKGELVAWRVGG
jgi:hypothetical protein